MTILDIKHQILSVLTSTDGRPLLESVMTAQCNARLSPRPPKADYDDAITALRSDGYIKAEGNEMEPQDPYWLLEDKGVAYAARKGL
jgi:hypothetical protein